MKRSIPASFTGPQRPRKPQAPSVPPKAAPWEAKPALTAPATAALAEGLPRTAGLTRIPVFEDQKSSTILAFYAFLLISILFQFANLYIGVSIPWVAAAFSVVGVAFLLSRNVMRFFKSPLGVLWIALLVWWILAGAVGIYRGRSLTYLATYTLRIHSLPLIFCALARTPRGVQKVVFGAGVAVIPLLLACAFLGKMDGDRFVIANTSLGNANDLALSLLLSGCFFISFLGGNLAQRILFVVTLPFLVYFILKTGSRANLITMAVAWVICFLYLPGAKKIVLLTASIILPALAVPLLPSESVHRLFTFFSPSGELQTEEEYVTERHAIDSSRARLLLQQRALEVTVRHPLLGVGPLNFEDAVEQIVREKEGVKSGWQVAHNSYLDVAAETGVPGFLIFASIIGACVMINYRNLRRYKGKPALTTFAILLGSVVYAVGILFCSIAYDYYLSLIVGLTTANHLALTLPRNPAMARISVP
jgi:O-antigen ligase